MLRRRSTCGTRVRSAVVLLSTLSFATACGPSDPAIQAAVDSQLAVDSATATLSLDITVTSGVVRLDGGVQSREQERRAVELARGIRGVKDVVNALYLNDETVVAAVKRALAADPLIGKIPIEVESDRGNVSLMSDQTTKEDRTRAVAISSTVDGVKRVEDLMR
jgi:osmotically-inducible protein OsmY